MKFGIDVRCEGFGIWLIGRTSVHKWLDSLVRASFVICKLDTSELLFSGDFSAVKMISKNLYAGHYLCMNLIVLLQWRLSYLSEVY